MKIAHVSDIHIRNFKYRQEYRAAFNELYERLDELKPDLIINTGDTVHSKLAVSPELFDDVANHFLNATDIAPYWVILGNHDLNLKNSGRMDAISPIVRALQGRTAHELRIPEPYQPEQMLKGQFPEFVFWSYDIRSPIKNVVTDVSSINVGLYHGSISGCITDQGFVMDDGEAEVEQFKSMDFVLLGDIHKRQSFRDQRMQYPGSLIQQNYGEELVKGFLLWDIKSRDDFSVDFYRIKDVPGRFYTVQVPANLDLTDVKIPSGSRVKAVVEGELTPSKRLELEKALITKFSPVEVITPDSSGERVSQETAKIDDLVGSREQMMRDHLREKGLDDNSIEAVVKLFDQFEKDLELDDSARGTTWKLKKVTWDNMMNYGEGNAIDLEKLQGLVGVFAPNASGKSSIFDIVLQAVFDKVSKDVPRNIDLVNDNKDSGKMTVEFEAGTTPFTIERTIERIQYGQRKFTETKQWGKTSLDFSSVDDSLNGTTRPETERAIRNIVGTFEDFVLTTMVSQNPIFGLPGGGDIINCRETDRRKILFRFLDLDVFEKINQACKEELKGMLGSMKGQDRDAVEVALKEKDSKIVAQQAEIESARDEIASDEAILISMRADLERLEDDDRTQAALDLIKLDDAVAIALKKRRLAENAFKKAEEDHLKQADLLKKLSETRPERPKIDLDELAKRMEAVRKEREAAKLHLSRHKDDLARGKRALKTLDDVPCEGKFPTCKFISEASDFLTQKEIVEAAVSFYETALEASNSEFSTLSEYDVQHSDVTRWERELAMAKAAEGQSANAYLRAQRELAEANEALQHAERKLLEAKSLVDSSITDKIDDLKKRIDERSSQLAADKRSLEARLMLLGAEKSKRDSLASELANLDEMKKKVLAYEHLADATGKNGLPYKILTLVLPIINDEISKILSGVVKFNVFFEDDPDEQTVSLFIRYGDYKSRPLSLGSGAEKFIASLAIRVALLSVSSLPKTDILIIDEGFGKLDPEHLESLQRMFEYLKGAFGTVFIISHVDSMRDIVDHSLEILSQDGYAHLEAT